ncbi:hypothetical protein B0H17DRAFT_1179478 [Mycena rosella]|uniref:Uncharacterized protein n=1 Tax=Mycena rosella TaxID=1033263 RepID=A0AAD7DHZ4_MYCRO|nr:hypothetical protein B0H17DRAFT_1179478 [Mycena rosella]
MTSGGVALVLVLGGIVFLLLLSYLVLPSVPKLAGWKLSVSQACLCLAICDEGDINLHSTCRINDLEDGCAETRRRTFEFGSPTLSAVPEAAQHLSATSTATVNCYRKLLERGTHCKTQGTGVSEDRQCCSGHLQ